MPRRSKSSPLLIQTQVPCLRARGAEVVSVSSVREAVQVLNANGWKPQVLVSDLGMPEEDGYDLIRKLRSRAPEECGELPAIAITGYVGEDLLCELKRLDCRLRIRVELPPARDRDGRYER
jgi:CheY-like chemotaxis protein